MKVYIHKKAAKLKKYKYNNVTIVVFRQRDNYQTYTSELWLKETSHYTLSLSLHFIVKLIGRQIVF